MEVKIGVQSIPRELTVETTASAEDVEQALREAATDGGLLILDNDKGGKVIIPADKIGYVELAGSEQRRIGFGQYT
ncbi:MAG TPA: DUF3107 domain-containing protein [Streptosporangiaceae bacterium]|nr:DUF3107 domain-containing protein [Streptosporangiaceae bacterium]